MTSPIDPRSWLPRLPGRADDESWWLDTWFRVTRWWVEPARIGADMWSRGADEILAEIVDGLTRRFGGKRVELNLRGRPVRAVLESLRLLRRGIRYEARLDVSEVDWNGVAVEQAAVVARSVRLDLGVPARVSATDIDVVGHARLASLVGWLDGQVAEWALGVDDAGQVVARHIERSLVVVVEPTARNDALELELRAVAWRRLRIRAPSWLRLRRLIAVPPLPPGLSLVDANRRDELVDFRLRMDAISQPIELGQLRDAILRAQRILLP